jgi:hypothetical protein
MKSRYRSINIITVFFSAIIISLLTADPIQAYTSQVYEKCVRGNGIKKTIDRSFPNRINLLEITGPLTVNVISDHIEQHVKITADENLLDLIKTIPHGNKLVIFPEKQICSNIGLTIDITVSTLLGLVTNTAGEVNVSGINTQHFSLVSLDSEDISLAGQAYQLTAEVSGDNNLNAGNLQTRESCLNISGSGMTHIRVSERLDVNIEGLADVYYSGDPRQIIKNFVGAGTLQKIE